MKEDRKFVDIMDLAKYVLEIMRCNDIYISNIMLQKVLYILQIDYIEEHGRLLFSSPVFAVKFGPKIRDVYYEYSSYGSFPILDTREGYLEEFRGKYKDIDIELIDQTSVKLGLSISEDNFEIIREVHKGGGPWDIAYKEGKENQIIEFSNEVLIDNLNEYEVLIPIIGYLRKNVKANSKDDAIDIIYEESTSEDIVEFGLYQELNIETLERYIAHEKGRDNPVSCSVKKINEINK